MNKIIDQDHSGSGDNVRDKIINQSVSPSIIKEQLVLVLDHIRERQVTKAKEQLDNLKTTANLDSDARGIIEVLDILISLAEESTPSRAYKTLTSYISSTEDKLCLDIAKSALIRFFLAKKRPEDAKRYYKNEEAHGVYERESFYEFLASEDEIEKSYKDKKLSLTDGELSGLVGGSLRLANPKLALTLAEYFNDIASTSHSETLLLASKIEKLNLAIEGKQYWSINASLRTEVIALCDEAGSLLNKTKGKDNRVIQMSVGLLQFLFFDCKPLADICWDYITIIESHFPDIAVQLRQMYETSPKKIDHTNDTVNKMFKTQSDPTYKKEVLADILEKKTISADDVSLLKIVSDEKELQEWFQKGGKITDEDEFIQEFSFLDLRVSACNKNAKDTESIKLLVTNFIGKNSQYIKQLSQPRLLFLADKLLDLGLPVSTCELLKPLIEEKDLWVSPLVFCYLNALLASQQFRTLNSILDNIDENHQNYNSWEIKSRQFFLQHKYNKAINCIEEAIKLVPNTLHGWHLLVDYHQKAGSDKNIIFKLFKRIPLELFSNPSELGFIVLRQMLRVGYFQMAETYLVDWFVENPERCAIPFLNVSLDSIINRVEETLEPSKETEKCFGGVEYLTDNKVQTKLLVPESTNSHQYLLSIESPLGQMLSNMSEGNTGQHGMSDIKLLRHIPPYTAIFAIATTLRQAINDGTDRFYVLDTPNDLNELPAYLERKLSMLKNNDRSDQIYIDPKVPLFMKGYYKDQYSPVKSTLFHLINKKSFKHPLPNFGEQKPSSIILDIYSVIYLSITGLVKGLDNLSIKTVVTVETKELLEKWCKDINQEDYMTIDLHPDGGLIRITSDEIKERTSDIQKGIKIILEQSEVITPQVIDFPSKLLILNNILDLSVHSSIKLMIANDIPWFCIDLSFAQLLNASGYKIANSSFISSQLSDHLKLDQKRDGLYFHVVMGLPFPLIYNDMFLLSSSKEKNDHYFLAELLKMYPDTFADIDMAVSFTSHILRSVLSNAFLDGEILRGFREFNPRNNGYAERIFYACCNIIFQCKGNHEAGYKFALFFIKLQKIFYNMPTMMKLINFLAVRFLEGHFMNVVEINRHIDNIISKVACVEE